MTWGQGDTRRLTTRDIPPSVLAQVTKRQGGKWCVYCKEQGTPTPPDEPLQIDHKRPLSKGGDNSAFNLQWACRAHNQGRGNRKTVGLAKHARGPQ